MFTSDVLNNIKTYLLGKDNTLVINLIEPYGASGSTPELYIYPAVHVYEPFGITQHNELFVVNIVAEATVVDEAGYNSLLDYADAILDYIKDDFSTILLNNVPFIVRQVEMNYAESSEDESVKRVIISITFNQPK